MAVAAISTPKVSAPSGYQKPPAIYDQVKSVVVPAGAWLYQNVWKPSQGLVKPAGNFWKELGTSTLKSNFMSALWYDGIGSVVRNGLALIQGKESVPRAAGNLVADVGIGAGKGIAAGLAVTGATMGLTAIGLTAAPFLLGWPIMLGTIGVSMLAYRFLNKADQNFGWHQKVSDAVTGIFEKK